MNNESLGAPFPRFWWDWKLTGTMSYVSLILMWSKSYVFVSVFAIVFFWPPPRIWPHSHPHFQTRLLESTNLTVSFWPCNLLPPCFWLLNSVIMFSKPRKLDIDSHDSHVTQWGTQHHSSSSCQYTNVVLRTVCHVLYYIFPLVNQSVFPPHTNRLTWRPHK